MAGNRWERSTNAERCERQTEHSLRRTALTQWITRRSPNDLETQVSTIFLSSR